VPRGAFADHVRSVDDGPQFDGDVGRELAAAVMRPERLRIRLGSGRRSGLPASYVMGVGPHETGRE